MKRKLSFKILPCLLWLLLLIPTMMLGQVNVGSPKEPKKYAVLQLSTTVVKGGVRLPQLSSQERDALTTAEFKNDLEAKGLAIFNMTTNCVEYWNKTKWVSLCQGQLDVSFNPELNPSFPKEGGVNGPYTPVDAYPCTGQTPYGYVVITGADYTNIELVNSDNGSFSVIMTPNVTATARMAIIRVTNNCTGESKEFLFSQEGNADLCSGTAAPVVEVGNGGVLCVGGAVYMKISNASAGVTYIWTINEIEQGTGVSFVATRPGIYKVYVGAIGCPNSSNAITITSSSTTAPNNPISLSATNNGVICGSATVTLSAFNVPVSGTLTWYYNGMKSSKTGNPISLNSSEDGNWFAVVESESCTSTPSATIAITVDNTSTPLAAPVVYVNGNSLASVTSFCSNGRIELSLHNYDSYTTGVSVHWYNGMTLLGEGERLIVTTPTNGVFALRCVVSDNVGAFCSSELLETKALTGTAPSRPVIVSNPAFICGGTEAQLTATVQGGDAGNTFNWYKAGVLIVGENAQTLTVSETGSYEVEVVSAGGCVSTLSVPMVIGLSDFPKLSWQSTHSAVEPGEIRIYQVSGTFAPTTYTWRVDGNATIQNGQGTNTLSVKFPTANGVVNISVIATNACGVSDELKEVVNVAPSCTPVVVRSSSMSPLTGNLVEGGTIALAVTATGSNPIRYQWYRDGIMINGATASTYIKNSALSTDSGVYTCTVTNDCTVTAIIQNVGTIKVTNLNAITDGTGSLAGISCFDVAVTEGPECGTLASRTPLKADFTKSHVYTFTNVGTGNKGLSFIVDDPQGAVVSAIQGAIPAVLVNGARYTLTVTYKVALMTTAIASPIEVKIAALYKTASNVDNKTLLKVTIKDCQCCGAYVAAGEWKNFMCHNLGADETLDPMVPVKAIAGSYYQWGRRGVIATSDTGAGTTITGINDLVAPASADWKDAVKTANDPCPTGYKVPSRAQMEGLGNSRLNPQTRIGNWSVSATNFGSGLKFGTTLYLPLNGYRSGAQQGMLTQRGRYAQYWTSTVSTTSSLFDAYYMGLGGSSVSVSPSRKNGGYSIRCIAE